MAKGLAALCVMTVSIRREVGQQGQSDEHVEQLSPMPGSQTASPQNPPEVAIDVDTWVGSDVDSVGGSVLTGPPPNPPGGGGFPQSSGQI